MEAKVEFIREFTRIVPSFKLYLDEAIAEEAEQSAQREAAEQENKIKEEKDRESQKEKQIEELQRRSIQVKFPDYVPVT